MSDPCRKADGTPKKIYSCRWDAEIYIIASRRLGQMKTYPCAIHGWHVGGILTRRARAEMLTLRTRQEREPARKDNRRRV